MTQSVSGTAGDWKYFTIELPGAAAALNVELSGGRGDADIYVRAGEAPTESAFDCRPYLVGNEETCSTPNPRAGVWHVGVRAFTDFSDATLALSWPLECAEADDGAAAPAEADDGAADPADDGAAPAEPNDGGVTPVGADDGAAAAPPDASTAAWLDSHNALRADHCAAPLTWNEGLAASAQAWADACVFEHDPTGGFGENLFANTGDVSADAAVDAWYAESADYDFSTPGFSQGTGHFTQVVWQGTTRVGCAIANCPGLFGGGDASFYVCRYSPPGNVGGQFQDNVLPDTCQ